MYRRKRGEDPCTMMYRMFIGKPKSSNENEVKGEGVYQNDLTSLEEGAFKPVAQGKRREYMNVPDNNEANSQPQLSESGLMASNFIKSLLQWITPSTSQKPVHTADASYSSMGERKRLNPVVKI